jgi:hypothetical protein
MMKPEPMLLAVVILFAISAVLSVAALVATFLAILLGGGK